MSLVSLVLVVAGFLGSTLGGPHGLIALSFLGLFGPFVARELGWLRWRDDFQREAVMRSGMHALIAVGLLATIVVALRGAGGSDGRGDVPGTNLRDDFPMLVVFLLMAITWGVSWLLQFWGTRTGAFRILVLAQATATVVLLVTLGVQAARGAVMSGRGLASAGVQLGVVWVLVALCRRWPRAAGALLIAVVASNAWSVRTIPATFGLPGAVLLASLVCVPFVVPAVALLASRPEKPAAA